MVAVVLVLVNIPCTVLVTVSVDKALAVEVLFHMLRQHKVYEVGPLVHQYSHAFEAWAWTKRARSRKLDDLLDDG